MTLRKHQLDMLDIAARINRGEPIKRIYASVTPGGGKSALPALLARELLGLDFDSIVWVVPRNSLRDQGEADFANWTKGRIMRAAGNSGDPFRGCDGYITTYQAIVADPEFHRAALRGRRYILFLDEPHHVAVGGAWDRALSPLVAAARLVVYASGTFARGDGQRIAGVDYYSNGSLYMGQKPGDAIVRYSRETALREGSIMPVSFRYLDGRTEWEEEGERRSADSLAGGDYAPQALFTALRTEYALELLDECAADWKGAPKGSKLLVVAPNISLAGVYAAHLCKRKINNLIATSADDSAAREAIARFKGQAYPSTDCLVTVAMAYEGLSVPAITHIAALTHIRSIPWLEQLFARANRLAPGKTRGIVYGPNDERFREAIQSIEAEQVLALRDREERGGEGEAGEGKGPARPWIQPISSAAIRLEGALHFDDEEPAPFGGMTPSQAEKLLRTEIARHIEVVIGKRRPGSKAAVERIIMRSLKELVGGKAREECTVDELTAQWAELKRRWPV